MNSISISLWNSILSNLLINSFQVHSRSTSTNHTAIHNTGNFIFIEILQSISGLDLGQSIISFVSSWSFETFYLSNISLNSWLCLIHRQSLSCFSPITLLRALILNAFSIFSNDFLRIHVSHSMCNTGLGLADEKLPNLRYAAWWKTEVLQAGFVS